jgi:O-glycosyl hydrolase
LDGLKVIGSPRSAPGRMKTSASMIQGSLVPSSYVTMQNEPLHVPHDYQNSDL